MGHPLLLTVSPPFLSTMALILICWSALQFVYFLYSRLARSTARLGHELIVRLRRQTPKMLPINDYTSLFPKSWKFSVICQTREVDVYKCNNQEISGSSVS